MKMPARRRPAGQVVAALPYRAARPRHLHADAAVVVNGAARKGVERVIGGLQQGGS
jgi:hypothetical protein